MKVGIIGAGKVGCSMGKYFMDNGITVTGYSSRSKESVEKAATFTKTKAFDTPEQVVSESDLIFLATPDGKIEEVWKEIALYSIQGKVFCHFSGALSSNVFSGREEKGVHACSLHPMYAFNDKFTSYEKLNSIIFTAEGDEAALTAVRSLMQSLGNEMLVMRSDKKVRYHASASILSNMMIGLYETGIRMLADCGFAEEEAKKLAKPLVSGNIHNLLATSPEEALSGPIERGDVQTVQKHLEELTGQEKRIYVSLGQEVVRVAGRKNKNQNYEELKTVLCTEGEK